MVKAVVAPRNEVKSHEKPSHQPYYIQAPLNTVLIYQSTTCILVKTYQTRRTGSILLPFNPCFRRFSGHKDN